MRPFLILCAVLALAPTARAEAPRRAGVGISVGAALDRGGFQTGLAGRYALTPRLLGGLTAEWSPWVDVLSRTFSNGTANVYATLSWRWLDANGVELRSALHAGTSVLLFEPVGARRGSVGLFVGASLLGLSIPVGRATALELTPDVTLSAPWFGGVPLVYRQYRLLATLVRWL